MCTHLTRNVQKMSCSSGCTHKCDHSVTGSEFSLYSKIDRDNLECLNETVNDSCKSIFCAWEDRLNESHRVDSDSGPDLLINIPFTMSIKLTALIVICESEQTAPRSVKLYKNREKMTFDQCNLKCDQEIQLQPDFEGRIQYTIQTVRFSSVNFLSLYFPTSRDDETTTIRYIGLKGEFFEPHRHGVTICTYEARPLADDIRNKQSDTKSYEIQ